MIVLPEAVRSGYSFGHVGDPNPTPFSMNAAAPRPFTITFPSPDWIDPAQIETLWIGAELERSLDGGATWVGFGAIGNDGVTPTNVMGKGGVIHPPSLLVSWDGRAMLVRGSCVVGPNPFRFAIDIT